MKHLMDYQSRLAATLAGLPLEPVMELAESLRKAWLEGRQVFICGNGGSAANALHLANDLFYGIAKQCSRPGLRVNALPANQSVMTCLANDVSYTEIFSEQLKVYAQSGDILIALSGSGNSPNIVRAIDVANDLRMRSFAILGYSGGKCLEHADVSIHVTVNDMQIAEDIQLIIGHMLMQWLQANPPQEGADNV